MSSISLKRIQKEFQNLVKDPSDDFVANPIKDDMFCWHFTIRGPPDTEFEGGLYHGVIKLPMSYPYRPPNIMFLTPNGRFDINMDVCLSMTKYHKEEWQAAWTIRSMLEAIIAFFPVKEDHDAIGALESSPENRRYYAKQSIKYKCDICGPIANILKPIEKMTSNANGNSNNNENNENKKENVDNINENNDNKNSNANNSNTNKNIKIIPTNIKKDVDSSSNSSLSSNQTGKFKFKREIIDSKAKKIIINKNINNSNNSNKEILFNSKEEKDEKEENNNINNEQEEIFNYINPEPEENNLLQSLVDDIEYIDIKKSIKCHGNKTNEEIESNLLKKNNFSSINNFFKLKNLFEKDFDLKIDEEDNKSADDDYQGKQKDDNDNGIFSKKKVIITKKNITEKKIEENMEENIKYIKYFSRKNYEDIRDKNKRNLNIIMGCIMVLILILYYFYIKYHSSISNLVKNIMLQKRDNN
jgi:ubiquitin-conjugating enzyme E2 J1